MNRDTGLLRKWESETTVLIIGLDLSSVSMIFIQVKGGADAVFDQVFRLNRSYCRILNSHVDQSSPKHTGRNDLHLICVEVFKFVVILRENLDLEDLLKGLF